jgi:pimeloyl-ACP methyl ester carboxylesterase
MLTFQNEENGHVLPIVIAQRARLYCWRSCRVFPGEIYRAPKSWAERAYRKLIYFHEVDKGGHFAAGEQPALFSTEVRAAFRPLC